MDNVPVTEIAMISRFGLVFALALTTSAFASPVAPPIGFRIVAEYPRDPNAFTQGFVYHDGSVYESTGRRGESSLREVELSTGRVRRRRNLSDRFFGEGLAIIDGSAFQLTWTSGIAFVYDLDDFSLVSAHTYEGEGWGLTSANGRLVMSDGSSILRFRNPNTFVVEDELQVRDGGQPVALLNELEFANGAIFANVFRSNRIARIDPTSGRVTGWLDISELVERERARAKVGVANGVAWDGRRLLVTGKLWTRVYALELSER